jgi:hypothetical protein
MKRILAVLTMWLAAVAAAEAGPAPSGAMAPRSSAADAKALPTAAQVTVTEFHHPVFNHYFITAYADEAAHLAAGGLPPWVATGHTFKVWGSPDQGITNVCRFFSATFAPRSSHFYSNNPAECPGLSAGGVWQLESPAAFYMMPTATGSCPSGTTPLYRLYNDGRSGAPNHRYTIDSSVRATMIAAGWMPEGTGPNGVFACVPLVGAAPPPPPNASAFQVEVTGYVNTLLNLVSGDVIDVDKLGVVLGSALAALLDPASTCPVVTTTPPLGSLTSLPPNLRIDIDYGGGCTVQEGTTSATVAGSVVLSLSNVVLTDSSLSGTLAATFNNVRAGGVLVANGMVRATANLYFSEATGVTSGPINATLTNFLLPGGLGVSGTLGINLNSAGTTTVTTDLLTSPNNVAVRLNASAVPAGEGIVVVSTTGASTVGAYSVQVSGLRIDTNVCTTGAVGGTVSFSKAGQTGTFTFNSSCTYTYAGP